MNIQSLQQINNSSASTVVNQQSSKAESIWGEDGFTFGDVLDMFNPLHHLPIIAKVYREQAHDNASEGSRLIGGVLFGGLLGGITGVLTSITNSAIQHETQKSMSEHVLAIADESLEHLSDGFLQQSTDDSVQDAADGSLQEAADGSLHNVTQAISINEIKSQSMVAKNETMNPFFAQIFDEYSVSQEQVSAQRIRDWGKV